MRQEAKAVSSTSIKAVPRTAVVASSILHRSDPRLHTGLGWAADTWKSDPQLTMVLTPQESGSARDRAGMFFQSVPSIVLHLELSCLPSWHPGLRPFGGFLSFFFFLE